MVVIFRPSSQKETSIDFNNFRNRSMIEHRASIAGQRTKNTNVINNEIIIRGSVNAIFYLVDVLKFKQQTRLIREGVQLGNCKTRVFRRRMVDGVNDVLLGHKDFVREEIQQSVDQIDGIRRRATSGRQQILGDR